MGCLIMKNKGKALAILILSSCCMLLTGCSEDASTVSINSNQYDPIFVDYKGTKEVEKIGITSTTNESEHIAE